MDGGMNGEGKGWNRVSLPEEVGRRWKRGGVDPSGTGVHKDPTQVPFFVLSSVKETHWAMEA